MNTTCNKKLSQNTFIYSQARISLVLGSAQFSAHKHWKAGCSQGTRLGMRLANTSMRKCNTCTLINTLAIYICTLINTLAIYISKT